MRTGDGSEGLSMSGVEYSNRGENITCVSAICKDYFLMEDRGSACLKLVHMAGLGRGQT